MFAPFMEDGVSLIGVEAAGMGVDTPLHAATLTKGSKGVIHGSLTYLLQDENGQITEPYSISAGLDYPGIGPEHAYLKDSKKVEYKSVTDNEALEALEILAIEEGIIPAIESAHALSIAFSEAKTMSKDETILVCLSGRGDKDVDTLIKRMEAAKDDDNV
jgi:tryptophan synthase beta chain